MNANAYGGQLGRGARVGRRLHRRRASSAAAPTQLGFAYRSSNLGAGEVVSRASFRLAPGRPEEIRATLAAMRERRREAQPSGIKTFGSTFKNPEDERAEGRIGRPAARGGRLPRPAPRRRPLLREARQLRRERRRGDHRRRARADGRGPAARPRALRRRAGAGGPGAGRGRAGRAAGSCEAALSRRRRCRRRRASASTGSSSATSRSTPTSTSRSRRRRSAAARTRSASPPTAGRPWLPPPEEPACRAAARPSRPKGGRCRGPALRTGPRPRRRAGRAAPLRRRQLLRRKRGGRRTHARGSNCASATPSQAARKWRAAAAVLADPSMTALDYVDLHAPEPPGRTTAPGTNSPGARLNRSNP